MFSEVVDVLSVLWATVAALAALDYLFGTDKFQNLWDLSDEHQVESGIIGSFGCVVFFRGLATLFDIDIMMDFTTFVGSIYWVGLWFFFTVKYIYIGVTSFREYNLNKRSK